MDRAKGYSRRQSCAQLSMQKQRKHFPTVIWGSSTFPLYSILVPTLDFLTSNDWHVEVLSSRYHLGEIAGQQDNRVKEGRVWSSYQDGRLEPRCPLSAYPYSHEAQQEEHQAAQQVDRTVRNRAGNKKNQTRRNRRGTRRKAGCRELGSHPQSHPQHLLSPSCERLLQGLVRKPHHLEQCKGPDEEQNHKGQCDTDRGQHNP